MFGSHLSIAGGIYKAALEAERLGFDTVQIFTANPRTFHASSAPKDGDTAVPAKKSAIVDPEVTELWKRHCRRLKFKQTVSHDSYLINLASPDDALRRRSIELFFMEISRCAELGIPLLVTHPGAHMGQGEDVGLQRVAGALDEIYARLRGPKPITCLEITAGQGTSLGWQLEHLTTILATAKCSARLGVCLDTAHLFAAGYDFRGKQYSKFRKQLDSTIGIARVKVLHLNDSKKELGSRVDRHEHIGRGTIGLEGFRPFLNDDAFADVPKILETAKEKDEDGRDWDAINLETLKSLLK